MFHRLWWQPLYVSVCVCVYVRSFSSIWLLRGPFYSLLFCSYFVLIISVFSPQFRQWQALLYPLSATLWWYGIYPATLWQGGLQSWSQKMTFSLFFSVLPDWSGDTLLQRMGKESWHPGRPFLIISLIWCLSMTVHLNRYRAIIIGMPQRQFAPCKPLTSWNHNTNHISSHAEKIPHIIKCMEAKRAGLYQSESGTHHIRTGKQFDEITKKIRSLEQCIDPKEIWMVHKVVLLKIFKEL